MGLPITPTTLSNDEFNEFTQQWLQLVESSDVTLLRTCFASGTSGLSNYAYLPSDLVTQLLSYSETFAICTKFVLSGDSPAFSMAVYGVGQSGDVTTPYFLMGVASMPATIENDMPPPTANEQIPAARAAEWILNWHAITPATLTFAPFDSADGMLMGYTFPLSDFKKAWEPAEGNDAALWLNFDLHTATDVPLGPLLFSTIVTLNKVPAADAPGVLKLSPGGDYYDISKPCPPYC